MSSPDAILRDSLAGVSRLGARAHSTTVTQLLASAAGAGVLVATAGTDDGVVLCPFRRCTGGYCPGCGATRAANHLARGDVAASWTQHPWIVLAALQMLALVGIVAVIGPARARPWIRRSVIALLVANTALLVGIWVVRLSSGTIPTGWL